MGSSLSDMLAVVSPALSPALVPLEARTHIEALAASLAPVPCCGWEVRLGESEEVDFHEGILMGDGAAQPLLEHLRREPAIGGSGLQELVARCCGPRSSQHDTISELWLEFDRPLAPSLSVFVGFRRDAPVDWATARSAVEILAGGEVRAEWCSNLERCFDCCPQGALVSHLGLMLGRTPPSVRLNVARLPEAECAAYLESVGWPGPAGKAGELMAGLSAHTDGITLCLDVGETLQSRLGLECHLDAQPPDEPRWERLLDGLVDRGWCTPPKRAALLEWPGVDTPTGSPSGWPGALLRDSLVQPADHFSTLHRRISHVKVDWLPHDRSFQAKAYLMARHRWMRPAEDEPRDPAPRRPRHPGSRGAAAAAAEFLLAARDQAGWWREFSAAEDSAGMFESGDEWVTAFAGTALASLTDARARAAARRGWDLLLTRRSPRDGWGFGRLAPVDAESTSWGIRLAAAVGAGDTARALRAREALEAHVLPGGGVATYCADVCPRPTGPGLCPPDGSYAGWHSAAHACIAAPVALAGVAAARDFLRAAQREDGSWRAYWWEADEYPTALAARALAASEREDDRARVDRAVRWAVGRLGRDGSAGESPFATAWVAHILRLGPGDPRARRALGQALAWLAEHQDPDGSWRASARMLSPRPDLLERPSPYVGRVAIDHARIFTTTSALFALSTDGT